MSLKKEEEIAGLLADAGLRKYEAKTLAVLLSGREVTSKDIEKATGLRQPEVSLAIKGLSPRGWIRTSYRKNPGKGRPTHVYSLGKKKEEILEEVLSWERKRIAEIEKSMERLRELF
ncbi:MAG: ArsR family transcriptional regulator [Thermoplasmata archaeon]|nr:ArsR family transcriptional regulator [Thermoplasmata archaeon]